MIELDKYRLRVLLIRKGVKPSRFFNSLWNCLRVLLIRKGVKRTVSVVERTTGLRVLLIRKGVKPSPSHFSKQAGLRVLLIRKGVKLVKIAHHNKRGLRVLLIRKGVKQAKLTEIKYPRLRVLLIRKGVKLGGKDSNAYLEKSLQRKLYCDIYSQTNRHFGVKIYKAIKRRQVEEYVRLVKQYEPPLILQSEIAAANSQEKLSF